MPLSSMLSKVSKEMSNYKMDSDGNIVKKKKDPLQEQSYGGGGSYGYSHGHGSSNSYSYGNGGYSNGDYQNGGGDDQMYGENYGPSQYEQQYYGGPPQGPPPGYHDSHQHSQYSPPPGAPPQSRSRLPFNPRMEMWSDVASDGNTYFCLGERHGTTAFSAKMPMMSGNLVVSAGGRKNTSNVLGEAKDSGMSRSSAVIALPNGFSCDLQKNSFKNIGEKSYTFTVPTEGGKQETFMWKLDEQGIKSMMKGEPSGWSLIREKDNVKPDKKNPQPPKEIQPLAKLINDEGMGMSSKTKMGHLEFVGEGASGSLGTTWAAVAVIAIVKAKAKEVEKTILQEVLGAV